MMSSKFCFRITDLRKLANEALRLNEERCKRVNISLQKDANYKLSSS